MWWWLGVARAVDTDGDGVDDADDVCDVRRDPRQLDADRDGFGDACDVCPGVGGGLAALGGPATIEQALDTSQHLEVVDLDGDGDRDLLAFLGSRDRLAWWRGTGGGALAPRATLAERATDGAVADVDGDGRLDVVLSDDTATELRWIRQLAPGLFAPPAALVGGVGEVTAVVALDADADGDADLATRGPYGLQLLRDTGAGYAIEPIETVEPTSLAAGDLDGDGADDLVYRLTGAGAELRVVRGGPTPGAPESGFRLEAAEVGELVDVDGDGDLDLTLTSDRDLRVATNDGAGRFAAPRVLWTSPERDLRSRAALDLDGRPPLEFALGTPRDLLVIGLVGADPGAAWQVLSQQPTGGTAVGALATGDLDGFGDEDVVTSWWDPNAGGFSWHANQVRCATSDTDGDGLSDPTEAVLTGTPAGDPDADDDGLSDRDELAVGADPFTADTDGDGLGDAVDACPADPANLDLDGDGGCDDADVCLGDDATGDGDGDGVCDDRDLCLGADASGDGDGDGLCEDADSCPQVASTPADVDGDGWGDACDVCPGPGAGLEPFVATEVGHLYEPQVVLPADADLDGDLDLVVGTLTRLAWLEHLGDGAFAEAVTIDGELLAVRDLEVADLDLDGAPELLMADEVGIHAVSVRGGGAFGRRRQLVAAPDAFDVAVGRVDADALPDLAVGRLGEVTWHPGLGGGAFGPGIRLDDGGQRAAMYVAFGDADADGDLDLFFAEGFTYLALNDGSGFAPLSGRLSTRGGRLLVAHTNGDGYADVVFGHSRSVIRLESMGPAAYYESILTSVDDVAVQGLAYADLDGLGAPDLVVGDRYGVSVLYGGAGDAVDVVTGLGVVRGVASADLAGDGLADLAVADELGDAVLFAVGHRGCGELDSDGDGLADIVELLELGTDATTPDTDADGVADDVELELGLDPRDADTDDDGVLDGSDVCPFDPANPDADADAVCDDADRCPLRPDALQADTDADGWGDACDTCSGVGAGATPFGAPRLVGPGSWSDDPPPPADLDLDGDFDAWWLPAGPLENLGYGELAERPAPVASLGRQEGVIEDIDRDGLPDLVYATAGGLSWIPNLGSFTFGLPIEVQSGLVPTGLAAGDLDGDTDPDLVACSVGEDLQLLTNAGADGFWAQPLPGRGCSRVALADVDSDGDLDVFADEDGRGTFWYENGAGWAERLITFTEPLSDLVPVDFDGDGDPDLGLAAYGGAAVLWENRGRGAFTQRWSRPVGAGGGDVHLAFGDLDGDGDLDVVETTAAVAFHERVGPWQLAAPVQVHPDAGVAVQTGDLDLDGDDDLLADTYDGLAFLPSDLSCVGADLDGDGLTDAVEGLVLGTDPRLADTDGGGATDGVEVGAGTDPLDPADDASIPDTGLPVETGAPSTADTGAPTEPTHTGATAETTSPAPPPGDEGSPGGCGCATSAPTPGWLALLSLLLRRRRRRPAYLAGE